MVLGQGAENPDIILISDIPSEEELSNGKAFVGSNQSLFRALFEGADYSLFKTYRTTFCKEPIPLAWKVLMRKGKIDWSKPPAELVGYITRQHELLKAELMSFHPKVIIGMGDIPLFFMGAELKVRKFRGSVIPSNFRIADKPIPYLSILPSRYIFQDIKWKIVTQADISKAVRLIHQKWTPFPEGYHLWTCWNDAALRAFLERTSKTEFYVEDIETIFNFITCIGLAPSPKEAVCIPLFDPRLSIDETIAMMRTLERFNREANIKKVGQNFNYDWTIMEKRGFKVNGFYGDTMLYSHVLYPDFPKGLDFLTSLYTDIPYYKDDGKEAFRVHSTKEKALDKLYIYNCTDCVANYQVFIEQRKEGVEYGVSEFYEKVEFPLIHLYHDIEQTGILVDLVQVDFLTNKYLHLLNHYSSFVNGIAEKSINFGSSKQVADFIYKFLELPPTYNKSIDEDTGELRKTLATDEETIDELAFFCTSSELIKSLLYSISAIRKLQKILQFLETPIHPDGRMRTGAKLTGTKSGRTSFSKSVDYTIWYDTKTKKNKKKQFGNSFQTLAKHGDKLWDGTVIGDDLRTIFVPRRNHCFIEGDKSQAEARVVAVLSNNLPILYYFDNPPGIHRITGGWIYGCPPEEIKKDTEEYNMGKRGRHMANYDGGPHRLAKMLTVPLKKASFVLDRIHEADPSIRDVFHARVKELLDKGETFETPQGRKRTNFKRVDQDTIKEFYSYIPQATVSDDVKMGLYRMWEPQSKDPWFKVCNEAHDSAMVETHRDNKERYYDLFRVEMQKPIDFRRGSFIRDLEIVIPVELAQSEGSWKTMEAVK